jgi:hypothetical protein
MNLTSQLDFGAWRYWSLFYTSETTFVFPPWDGMEDHMAVRRFTKWPRNPIWLRPQSGR